MGLIINGSVAVFDTDLIKPGDVVYAKHFAWSDGVAGVVMAVTDGEVVVQYHPGIGNVTNHYFIKAVDVARGNWLVRWSQDLTSILEYPETAGDKDSNEDTETDTNAGEVEAGNETGGTDI